MNINAIRKKMKPRWLISAALVLLVFVGLLGYIEYFKFYPSTDDAYVNANVVYMAAEVSGKVNHVYIQDHQAVKRGQLLLSIEPQQYRYAVARAKANYRLAQEQEAVSSANIKRAKDNINQALATLGVSQKKAQRLSELVRIKQAAKEAGDEAVGQYKADLSATNALKSSLQAALVQDQIAKEQTKAAKASYDEAKLNLQHTKIFAPTAGVISNFSLRAGAFVSPGQSLFAMVDTHTFWVVANFKETQLQRVQPKQSVNVSLDMYPALKIKGYVASISRGSGATFSLLPPENATGNWVKVAQRFPVKIAINSKHLPKNQPLRVGASATVSINTL